MLVAALRRRLDRLNSLQSSLLASQEDHSEPAQFLGQGLVCTPNLDSAYATSKDICTPNSSSRPTTASSKGSTVSISADISGISTPEGERPHLSSSTYEAGSGIRWNRAVPAFSLLQNAGFEAQQPNPDTRLVRSLFIGGLGYLLAALPLDLTVGEARSIQERLPEPVKVITFTNDNYAKDNMAISKPPPPPPPPPSYLHRLISTLIVQAFIFIQIILPYVTMLLNSIYRYERRYRVTEKFLAAALKIADEAGKGAHDVGSVLSAVNEGRITVAVGSVIAWLSESVAGGVYDGVVEGLSVLKAGHSPNGELEAWQSSS